MQRYTTGELARLLNRTEPQLGEVVRRGRVQPRPTVIAGRRLWSLDQAMQAAGALGIAADVAGEALARQTMQESDAHG